MNGEAEITEPAVHLRHGRAERACKASSSGLRRQFRRMPAGACCGASRWNQIMNRLRMPFLLAMAGLGVPMSAHASFLHGEALDNLAMGMAWFIIIVMPIVGILVFWKLHVLPERIAAQRHHPQKDAIHVLCLLSLVFGGLLWPFAWLWAYTRPTSSYLAYGTDKHEDYFHNMGVKFRAGELTTDEIEELREELDAIASKSRLSRKLKALRSELDAPPRAADVALPAGEGAA
jgi:hypothetical protein